MAEYIFLPLISFASGFASLYIDPKTDKARAWIVISVLFASALATGIYGYADGNSHASEIRDAKKDAKDELKLVQTALDVEKAGQDKIDKLTEKVVNLSALLPQTEGDKPSLSPTPSVSPPLVEYFAKAVDGDAITKAARVAGFAVVTMPGQHPGATNAMWIGDEVSLTDTKALALALIQQGVQLRALRRFRDGSGSKSRLIEIGRDEALGNAPILTPDQIQKLIALPSRASGK